MVKKQALRWATLISAPLPLAAAIRWARTGVYKYIQELWKKKQSDVMHLLLRAHCWQYHQLSVLHRSPNPTQPDKACGLGYTEPSKVMPCAGFAQLLQSIESWVPLWAFESSELLPGWWRSHIQILWGYPHCPSHKALRRSSDTQWITTPIHKHREMHGLTSVGRKSQGKGHKFHHMALAMQPGEGAVSSSTITNS